MLTLKETSLFQEIELYSDGVKIGDAEVDLNNNILSRLHILEPYQNQGYGTEIVKLLLDKYSIHSLWANADNARAIHVYEKCGLVITQPTMYLMEVNNVKE